LQTIRRIVQKTAPETAERLSYRIPAFYPSENPSILRPSRTASDLPHAAGVTEFGKELQGYETATGSIQFP
jgi:uncharacterized protein YdhG (YjbR/CyaY superfamily)